MASGFISGVRSVVGLSTVTLSATNAGGTGTKILTLTINPQPPVITSASSATGLVGSAFSYPITATNSPTSYDASGLPAGLSITTTNGLISGTPSVAGTSTVTLSATNAGGTGTKSLLMTLFSACDLNQDTKTDVADIQLEVNEVIGISACTMDINKDGFCNIVDI